MFLRRAVKKPVVTVILACLWLAACASGGRDLAKRASAESLAAGDFQKAIDAYREPFRKDPRNEKLAADFAGAVEEIKATADRARGRGDFALAGRIYRLLIDNAGDFKPFAGKLTFDERGLEAAVKFCRVSLVDGQARQDAKAGRDARALEAYSGLLREYPRDGDLAAKFLRTVREIKAAGDGALAANDFARAGKAYALLLGKARDFERLRPALPFGRTDLAEALAQCRDGLTKAGLAEYRKGNLAQAISIWESLLAFDPANAEIKKAVETARTQLKRIVSDNG